MRTWILKAGDIQLGRIRQFGPKDFSIQRAWIDSNAGWLGRHDTYKKAYERFLLDLQQAYADFVRKKEAADQNGITSEEEQ